MSDGTLDKLFEGFLAIDTNKLGTFTFSELCLYMGIKSRCEAMCSVWHYDFSLDGFCDSASRHALLGALAG